jgi:hypothetical protein
MAGTVIAILGYPVFPLIIEASSPAVNAPIKAAAAAGKDKSTSLGEIFNGRAHGSLQERSCLVELVKDDALDLAVIERNTCGEGRNLIAKNVNATITGSIDKNPVDSQILTKCFGYGCLAEASAASQKQRRKLTIADKAAKSFLNSVGDNAIFNSCRAIFFNPKHLGRIVAHNISP